MTAPDLRVAQAAEFLAGARRRKVGELPPSVLMRELAECRRQLGQILDVVRETVALSDDQLVTLGLALADALSWRAPDTCRDCSAGHLCPDHAEDVRRRDTYWQLAREAGIEVQL